MPESIQVERSLNGQFQVEHPTGGEVIVVPANTPHQLCWDKPAEFMVLTLDPITLAQSIYELINPEQVELLPHLPAFDPLLYQLSMALKMEILSAENSTTHPKTDRLYVETLTAAFSAHLLKHYTNRSPKLPDPHRLSKSALNRAIEYIHAHLDEEIRLADLAQELGFSACYFASMFKRSTGFSPHQYVIAQRLCKAKELLKTTNESISAIALQCGFASQSHLTKAFRQHFNLPPKAYRQAL